MTLRKMLVTSVVLASCTSTTGPLIGDIYVLDSIAGIALPAPYSQNGLSPERIRADTIALGPGNVGERRTSSDNQNEPSGARLERIPLTYVRSGSTVAITYKCNENADCPPAPTLSGTISDGGLTITQSIVSRQPLNFHRVFPE